MTIMPSNSGARASRWDDAWRDLSQSLSLTPFWMGLAYSHVRGRYQRLALGLIWHPLSYAFLVTSLGILWSQIMGRDATYFMPYLAIGFATWYFIFNSIAGATDIFRGARRHIMSRPTPLFLFVFEKIAANVMFFLMEAPFFFVMALIVGRDFGPIAFLAAPGFLLLMLNAVWMCMFMAIAVARFPDLGEMVRNVMRIAFFLTPVIWSVDVNPRVEGVSQWNPFFHAMAVVRSPFMGSVPDPVSYMVVGGGAVIGFAAMLPLFVYARRRVPYWV